MAVDFSRQIVARWEAPEAGHVPLLKEAAIQAVVTAARDEPFERACRDAGIETAVLEDLRFTDLKSIGSAGAGKPVVFTEGQCPGLAVDTSNAGATENPWLDCNGYWVAYLRALYPGRFPVLGYVPEVKNRLVPFDTLELSLAEAWAAGGNYLLSLEPRFRQALLRRDPQALAAWRKLGRTARWLQENAAVFRQPAAAAATLLVESGEATPELANLMFRKGVSPLLAPAADPPPPDPSRILVLVAAEIRPPAPAVRDRILAHAVSGASVVVNGDWWKAAGMRPSRTAADRDVYRLGRGQVLAYKGAVDDPGTFALDIVDLVTHARRPVRLWNARTIVPLASASGPIALVNYGARIVETMVVVNGRYASARMLRPEGPPLALKTARRGTTTEALVFDLGRAGIVLFG